MGSVPRSWALDRDCGQSSSAAESTAYQPTPSPWRLGALTLTGLTPVMYARLGDANDSMDGIWRVATMAARKLESTV